jgi:hypothetical protein
MGIHYFLGDRRNRHSLNNLESVSHKVERENRRLDKLKEKARKTHTCIYDPTLKCSDSYKCGAIVVSGGYINSGTSGRYHEDKTLCEKLAEKVFGVQF